MKRQRRHIAALSNNKGDRGDEKLDSIPLLHHSPPNLRPPSLPLRLHAQHAGLASPSKHESDLATRVGCRRLTLGVGAKVALIVFLVARSAVKISDPASHPIQRLRWPTMSRRGTVTRCYSLETDPTSSPSLPMEGQLIRLGDFALSSQQQQDYITSRSLLLLTGQGEEEGEGTASWDLLWDDYHGAFNQTMMTKKQHNANANSAAAGALTILPWRTPHNPIFMVLYSKAPTIRVVLRETVYATAVSLLPPYAGNNVTTSCPDEAELQHAVETIDAQTIFEQPVRQANFRTRTSSSGIVTVCTQLTVDRLPRLDEMAQMYQGPISAAVYVGFNGMTQEEVVLVGRFWDDESSESMRQWVDLHLVFDNKMAWYATGISPDNHGHNPYPINLLRQYAVDQARTEFILYQEADMVMMKNSHQLFVNRWDEMMDFYNNHDRMAVFVVPIYFYREEAGLEFVPRNKTDVRESLRIRRIFRQGQLYASHRKLDYEGWENLTLPSFLPYAASGDPKAIMNGQQEPYFIIRKQDMPPYNVLFWGMSADKESHTVNTNECGFVFYLHPDVASMNFGSLKGSRSGGWLNPDRLGNAGWRQAFVHGVHRAYKEEFQKIKRRVEGSTKCRII